MRRLCARTLLLAGVLSPLAVSPTAAAPIFADGFEACCTVGGTASGLDGRNATLRLNSGVISEDLAVNGNGAFRFSATLDTGASYSVSITSQPASGDSCTLENASDVMPPMSVSNITLSCGGGLRWDSGAWGDAWQ